KGFLIWKKVADAKEEKIRATVLELHAKLNEVATRSLESRGRGFGAAAEANENNPDWYRKNCAETRVILRQLYDWVIAPIADQIDDAEPLLLMPYASLCYLPFEAVLSQDGQFLGERHTVAYLLHRDHMDATFDALADPPRTGPDFWVAFGDPVGNLKSARSEVAEIRALFPKHAVHTVKTNTATEAELLRIPKGTTILHFATHGFLNGTEPSKTYLELAPEDPFDGKLEQGEVWPQLRDELACMESETLRLVVMSACDTARGAKDPRAEVLGLPDNFTAAGAPAVLASLWKVNTWSTGMLMAEFYERLAAGKTGIGVSLRDARRAMLEDKANGRYAHPYYWSPFILFGDWR
ncbi:MAG: CHAT domain-containing protein, partial [Planctomycetota bacterium]